MTIESADHNSVSAPNETGKAKRKWRVWLTGGIVAVAAIFGWNALVCAPVSTALEGESDASIVAYRKWLLSPSQIVIDVRSVQGTQSMAGMDRMLLKAAEALQDHEYDSIVLAYGGDAKLLMEGSYFRELGVTRQTQNPLYTMRTMQEHLHNLDGTAAFEQWSGGWLGVLGKQMEDHNEFHRRWWVQAASGLPG
ncbi:hypothetical protein [Novosphingobium sp. BL-52-GroH]|uniref:hypothetical protein n=1 Tax=Novosphingobium sp. BL-52-GroH TaxID=3349877 RepID=UPI00384D6755